MADLTLAISYDALRRLDDPASAVDDARVWSENVCFVTDRPAHRLTKFQRDHHLEQDYHPDPEPVVASLETIRLHFDTDRYVYVTADDEAVEADDQWEIRPVEEAADAAGWDVSDAPVEADESSDPFDGDDDWP
ncbi:MAG: hypothetical protein ABEJ22_00725 [Haloferacaceae archaeon]